jgi:hypothetical protein
MAAEQDRKACKEIKVMIIPFETKIDLYNPRWNRDSWARISGDMNTEKQRFSSCSGVVLGVKPGEAAKELCGFEVFLATRYLALEDGNIRRINKEVIFYSNPRTGEIIEDWTNPWTGEEVNVVQVANDPFNYTISDFLILAPEDFKSSDPEKAKPRKIPLIFPWREFGPDILSLSTDMHLLYPNSLDPKKFVRESSGPMVQVTEMMRYNVLRADLENPELSAVPYTGTWARITPWLPWMLMGQEPGHVVYNGAMVGGSDTSVIPTKTLEYAKANYPEFLNAPTEDYGPSHSSLEIYSRTQEPAPPKGEAA